MIEKGRHRKINLANRMCPLCRSEVEDEFHFSVICDKLKDIPDKFFQKLTEIVPLYSNFQIQKKKYLYLEVMIMT